MVLLLVLCSIHVSSKGFGKRSSSSSSEVREPGASGSGIGNSEVSLKEEDRKWRLEPSATEEWEVGGKGRGGKRPGWVGWVGPWAIQVLRSRGRIQFFSGFTSCVYL